MATTAPRRGLVAAAVAAAWTSVYSAVPADAATLKLVKDNEATSRWARPSLADVTASFMEMGTREHLESLRANMTTAKALEHIKGAVPAELHSFLKEKLQTGVHAASVSQHEFAGLAQGDAFLQARERHTVAVAANRAKGKAKAGSKAKVGDVDSARAMLNDMVEKTQVKMDQEKQQCQEMCSSQMRAADEAHQDMADYNAKGADARAKIIQAQSVIAGAQEELPRLDADLKGHRMKCMKDRRLLEAQLKQMSADAGTIEQVLDKSECKAAASASLLTCQKSDDGKTSNGIKFRHHGVRKAISQLQTKESRRKLHRSISEAMDEEHEKHSRHSKHGHHQQHHASHKRNSRRYRRELALAFMQTEKTRWRKFVPAGDLRRQKHTQRCSIRASPSCDTLRDKFLHMRAETEDKLDGIRMDLSQGEEMCMATDHSYSSQMESLGLRLKDAQAELAGATKIDTESHEQSRLKDKQVAELMMELEKAQHECNQNMKDLAGQLCGVRQIRQELYKMSQQMPFIQDCEVSAWTPEDCSATCGGGSQMQRRTVITPPSMGAGCPALTQQVSCNMQACPVDCRVGDWSGWSACTAKCGGGIMSRVRNVMTQSRHGGAPCEATTESEVCGNTACDQDCQLSEWTPWSACSKACDGGFRLRERRITEPAKGSGSCPARDHPARLEYLRCNPKKCAPAAADGKLKCDSKLDVVILLDGSGSVGESGWEKTKAAGAALVNAFKTGADGAQIAVLVFGGPTTWEGYKKCSEDATGTVNVETDCQIKWLSHFSTDAATVSGQVGSLAWPKGATLTGAALAAADTELGTGRGDAHSIVIVVTDGRPMNPRRTTFVAKKLRRRARLLWVPVTKKAPLQQVKEWASRPIADNVVALNDYTELDSVETINKVIADSCPKVE